MKKLKGKEAEKYIEVFKNEDYYFPEIEKYLSVVTIKKGEFLYEQFQKTDKLYFLREGVVKLSLVQFDGMENPAEYYYAPIILGELELLQVRVDSHPIQAVMDCTLIQLSLSDCKELITNNAKFLYALCKISAYKNVYTMRKMIALQTMNLEERLASWFLDYHNENDEILPITLTEMANYFGVTYRHLSRAIKKFSDDGAIENKRGKIKIIDYDYFRRILGGMTLE